MRNLEIKIITAKIVGGLHYLFGKFYGFKTNPFYIETPFTKIIDLFLKNFSKILDDISFLPPENNTKNSRIDFCNSNISDEISKYQKRLHMFLKLNNNYDYLLEYLNFIYSSILRVYSANNLLHEIKKHYVICPIYENYPIYEEIEY